MNTISMIKKDAIIPLEIGTHFFNRLQQLLIYIWTEQTEEDRNLFKTLWEEKKELSEPWMEHYVTLVNLLNSLERTAKDKGMTYEADVEEAIKSVD